MALPRMLLLEDDPAVRRFVEIALDTLELELLPCATLAEAYSALERDPVQLVLTDMTLPDGSGLDLLQWLSERGMACRTLVFSGSVDAALHQHLQDRGVWRVLTKPASVGSLVDAVGAALADLARETAAPPSSMPATATDLVNKYFGGNQGLFVAFRQSCLDQFVEDLRMGDPAVQAQDSAGLRRIAPDCAQPEIGTHSARRRGGRPVGIAHRNLGCPRRMGPGCVELGSVACAGACFRGSERRLASAHPDPMNLPQKRHWRRCAGWPIARVNGQIGIERHHRFPIGQYTTISCPRFENIPDREISLAHRPV